MVSPAIATATAATAAAEGQVVLVTGASSGFGSVTSSLLKSSGFRTFGTSRRVSDGTSEGGVEMLPLDVDSDDSVRRCVESVVGKTGRLDVLVNNAGFGTVGGIEETSMEEAKAQFETNFFGAVRMVKAVLPTMRRQSSGRIINVGSVAASLPVPFEGYYAASKAALSAFTEALRQEVKSFGILVSSVEPGFFRTGFGQNRREAASRIPDYDAMRGRTLGILADHVHEGGDPILVAKTIARVIASPSPRAHYLVGRERRFVTLKKFIPASMFESQIREHWKLDG